MATVNVETWKSALVTRFGKLAKKHVVSVMCDILAVDAGLKPVYLWDVLQPNIPKIVNLLNDTSIRTTLNDSLRLVTICDDLLVLNLRNVIIHLKRILNSDKLTVLVDVSSSLETPRIAASDSQIGLNAVIADILRQLECHLEHETNDVIYLKYDHRGRELCNLSTIFGLLLDYPVVYYYENLNGNCLSLCPLRVYAIHLTISDTEDGKISSKIYSFSIPEIIVPKVADKVSEWFDRLIATSCKHNGLQLAINDELVSHSTIIL